MRYFIANWKENKGLSEAVSWVEEVEGLRVDNLKDITIVICPPYPLIVPVKRALNDLPNVFLGAQNVSHFEEGAYTGEVSARMLKGIVDFVIIGHSERRKYFGETDEDIEQKIQLSTKYGLRSILCVRDEKDKIFQDAELVAYEPITSIGTGRNESLENILIMKNKLQLNENQRFIYGGSIDVSNISQYLGSEEIDGFLIATASQDPNSFYKIISQA